jgi:hypothetical protein
VLDILPRVLPNGVWLTRLSFKKEEAKTELLLDGMVYLIDSDKEFATLNQFVTDLKANAQFSKYFKEINIDSLDTLHSGNVMTIKFLVSCRGSRERQ